MNIFRLSDDPAEVARFQCNAHAVKMITESAQMLSTSHRMIDGYSEPRITKTGKVSKRLKYTHPTLDHVLYKSVHETHPCTVWTNMSDSNYMWHYKLFIAMCDEYTYRYGKVHACDRKFRDLFSTPPENIPVGPETPQLLAMNEHPECIFPNDPIKSYRMFYQTKQTRFPMRWTKRDVPDWFVWAKNAC